MGRIQGKNQGCRVKTRVQGTGCRVQGASQGIEYRVRTSGERYRVRARVQGKSQGCRVTEFYTYYIAVSESRLLLD